MIDLIADMLTRIWNVILARKAKVFISALIIKSRIADVLLSEGFISAVQLQEDELQGVISIDLRYDGQNRNAIEGIRRASRPGQRYYVHKDKLPRIRSGLGVAILTTSKGVMTDREARKHGIGGEILCEVW